MKVFVSWSGKLSKSVAQILKKWIERTIQSTEVFFSPKDIAKGEDWDSRITKELSQSDFGIICMTRENIKAPWINFEAGALAGKFGTKVTAVLIDINPSDLQGPVSRFQATKFTKEEFFSLFSQINKEKETPINVETFQGLFDAIWSQIESELQQAIQPGELSEDSVVKGYDLNSDRQILEEILQLVRAQRNSFSPSQQKLLAEIFDSKELNYMGKFDDFLQYLMACLDSRVRNLSSDDFTEWLDLTKTIIQGIINFAKNVGADPKTIQHLSFV